MLLVNHHVYCLCSIPRGVQYTGGFQYTGRISVHWKNISTLEEYHEYTGGVQYTGRGGGVISTQVKSSQYSWSV